MIPVCLYPASGGCRLDVKFVLFVFLFFAGAAVSFPANSYETHRYLVDDARLIVYPVNMSLNLRQKHALLYELANDIKASSYQEFADFVAICLQELARMYEEEAIRPDKENDRKIHGGTRVWRAETMSVANKLYQVADSVTPGMDLDVDLDDTGELIIQVDDQYYILSNPVINKPYELDDRIISRVCQRQNCSPELLSVQELFNRRKIIIEASWVIADGKKPEYATKDGLHFVFDTLEQRGKKQVGSLKLIKEIKLITESLQEAAKKGVLLDWDMIEIKPFLGSYDYRIQLNRFSDSIHLKLPELHHVDDWQEIIIPWIRAQVEENPIERYIDGDKALAYVLQ